MYQMTNIEDQILDLMKEHYVIKSFGYELNEANEPDFFAAIKELNVDTRTINDTYELYLGGM